MKNSESYIPVPFVSCIIGQRFRLMIMIPFVVESSHHRKLDKIALPYHSVVLVDSHQSSTNKTKAIINIQSCYRSYLCSTEW